MEVMLEVSGLWLKLNLRLAGRRSLPPLALSPTLAKSSTCKTEPHHAKSRSRKKDFLALPIYRPLSCTREIEMTFHLFLRR